MEFNTKKVYTALTAEELKSGDEVYFSNTMSDLKNVVEDEDIYYRGKIQNINAKCAEYRFKIDGKSSYSLAYLIKRSKEKKWRAFKNIDELISAWVYKTNILTPDYTMPTIWLKFKNSPYDIVSISAFCSKTDQVYVIDRWMNLYTLFDLLTFLDGSPCGMEYLEQNIKES